MKRFGQMLAGGILLLVFFVGGGCASVEKRTAQPAGVLPEEGRPATEVGAPEDVAMRIREFVLSPGDEIAVAVLDHEELSRKVIIPPDGRIYYPLVGEVDVRGKTLRQMREVLTEGLSRSRAFTLAPGDEISIAVYRNDDLNRRLIIPPDGRFFYPMVGEIEAQGKNPSQVREIIAKGLSGFVVDPQVSVDIVAYNKSRIVVDPQVSVEVTAFGGQKVFVLGEVNRPGVFTVDGEVDLVEAVTRAGGFTLDARQDSILVVRGGLEKPDLHLFDLEKFLKGKDLTQNASLQRGDIVYVPPTRIADVDRFFRHFSAIVNPIVTLETGIVLEPGVEDTFSGARAKTTVIVPPR